MLNRFRNHQRKINTASSQHHQIQARIFEELEPRRLLSASTDLVGNSLNAALVVEPVSSSAIVYTDSVTATDTRDYYKITLDSSKILDLSLSGLSNNANIYLTDSRGRTLSASTNPGSADENMTVALSAGTYYVLVGRISGNTTYSLSITTSDPIADNAGNTRNQAANLGTLSATAVTKTDYVGGTDTNDYYQFTVSGLSTVSLNLSGLAGNADLQLINSSGTVIAQSSNANNADESISMILTSGTYYVRVYHVSGNTNYTLSANATAIADQAGNTLTAAKNIGTLTTTAVTLNDFIGAYDANDYYSFTISSQSTLSLELANLSANAYVQILNASGKVLQTSNNAGNSDEAITTTLDAGEYFIRVAWYVGNTTYKLTVSATVKTPEPIQYDNSNPGSVTTANLVSLYELQITGSSGNDVIYVTQANDVLILNINGNIATYNVNNISEIAIWGGDGNDTITVTSSVTLNTRLYGGAGNDTLINKTTGRATIVSIGGGTDILTGNGTNTSFWFDSTDTANTTTADAAAGRVHKVTSFYQPFTTNTASANYVSLELNGQNLTDPTDSGATIRLANRSFWGTSPTADDINQGYLGDCYYLATLAGLATCSPNTLMELAVDLGDGTYAVMYKRNGVTSYVRVDGDLAAYGGTTEYNSTGSSGAIWACIMEKAYAFFRTGADTYASIEAGLMSAVFNDFGIANKTVSPSSASTTSLYSSISAALAAGKAVTIGTYSSVSSGTPLIGSHAYTVISASKDAYGNITYVVRNPWGFDGVSNSSDLSDGLVTITAAQLKSACSMATWMT